MQTRRLAHLTAIAGLVSSCATGRPPAPGCSAGNGGITLPDGFCAAVFADTIGVARHLAVGPDGTVYVALENAHGSSAGTTKASGEKALGGVAVLKDTTGDGRADVLRRIRTDGGSGIALVDSTLFFSSPSTVFRARLSADRLGFRGAIDTVVSGIPTGGHSSRSLAVGEGGDLFVNVGSNSNVCEEYRAGTTSADPCPELVTRAGIWRYARDSLRQLHPIAGTRVATGIRNAVALEWNPDLHALYGATHGRDGLAQVWPRLYSAKAGAEQPAEEFFRVEAGQDYGWPYCFYDGSLHAKVQAPEYGGDGKSPGRCATAAAPLIGFPGHWGPDGLHFYRGTMFPPRYRGGAFLAFHGSWNRAPEPQDGYRVVFVPFTDGHPAGGFEPFADGFAGRYKDPGGAAHRPVGLAELPDGSLLVTDDQRGRIWRVIWIGSAAK
jgi:glucose/arabinose dehydrogenase